MENFIEIEIEKIRQQVGNRKVLCAMSGGVDSSVVAVLLHKAIGDQLTCIFVDHGLLRKGEGDMVMEQFGEGFDMNIIRVNAQERFMSKLKGVLIQNVNVKSLVMSLYMSLMTKLRN